MRTGLIVIGAVIAALGAGLILTLFFLSGGPISTSQVSSDNPNLQGHANSTWVVSRSTSATASVTVTWSTSAPANVTLWPARPCVSTLGACPTGPAALSWNLSLSGKGTDSSSNASAYIIEVANPGGASLRFSVVVSVTYNPGSALPTWGWGVIAVGGLVLLSIGGIALFLGLFLPGGVYSERDAPLQPPPGSHPPVGPPSP